MAGMTSVPPTLSRGWQGVMDTSTSFWAHRMVLNLAQIKFSYIIKDLHALQLSMEAASLELVDALAGAYVEGSMSMEEVSAALVKNIEAARDASLKFFYDTMFKFADGYVNEWSEDGHFRSSGNGTYTLPAPYCLLYVSALSRPLFFLWWSG
jgi:dipeptidase